MLRELIIFAKRITYPHSYGTIHKSFYRHWFQANLRSGDIKTSVARLPQQLVGWRGAYRESQFP